MQKPLDAPTTAQFNLGLIKFHQPFFCPSPIYVVVWNKLETILRQVSTA